MDTDTEALHTLLLLEDTLDQEVERLEEELSWNRRKFVYLQALGCAGADLRDLGLNIVRSEGVVRTMKQLLQQTFEERLECAEKVQLHAQSRRISSPNSAQPIFELGSELCQTGLAQHRNLLKRKQLLAHKTKTTAQSSKKPRCTQDRHRQINEQYATHVAVLPEMSTHLQTISQKSLSTKVNSLENITSSVIDPLRSSIPGGYSNRDKYSEKEFDCLCDSLQCQSLCLGKLDEEKKMIKSSFLVCKHSVSHKCRSSTSSSLKKNLKRLYTGRCICCKKCGSSHVRCQHERNVYGKHSVDEESLNLTGERPTGTGLIPHKSNSPNVEVRSNRARGRDSALPAQVSLLQNGHHELRVRQPVSFPAGDDQGGHPGHDTELSDDDKCHLAPWEEENLYMSELIARE